MAFQPSDLAKLSFNSLFIKFSCKKQYDLDKIKTLIIPFIWIGLICMFIALANLSTALILELLLFF